MNGKVWNSIKNCILSSYLQHSLRKLKLVQLLDTWIVEASSQISMYYINDRKSLTIKKQDASLWCGKEDTLSERVL